MLSLCFLDFSVGVGPFVIGLSHIASFFSLYNTCMKLTDFRFELGIFSSQGHCMIQFRLNCILKPQ